jgi:hypothetical protein
MLSIIAGFAIAFLAIVIFLTPPDEITSTASATVILPQWVSLIPEYMLHFGGGLFLIGLWGMLMTLIYAVTDW